MQSTRDEVYGALNGERAYQDMKYPAPYRTARDSLRVMERYVLKAGDAARLGDEIATLEALREATALGVATMERHGAVPRTISLTDPVVTVGVGVDHKTVLVAREHSDDKMDDHG